MKHIRLILFSVCMIALSMGFICHAHKWQGNGRLPTLEGAELQHKEALYQICDIIALVGGCVLLILIAFSVKKMQKLSDVDIQTYGIVAILAYIVASIIYGIIWSHYYSMLG